MVETSLETTNQLSINRSARRIAKRPCHQAHAGRPRSVAASQRWMDWVYEVMGEPQVIIAFKIGFNIGFNTQMDRWLWWFQISPIFRHTQMYRYCHDISWYCSCWGIPIYKSNIIEVICLYIFDVLTLVFGCVWVGAWVPWKNILVDHFLRWVGGMI